MKNTLKFAALLLVLCILLGSFAGCSKKTEISTDAFKTAAEELGYVVHDVSDGYDSAVIDKCWTARYKDNGEVIESYDLDYQFLFMHFTSNLNAEADFEKVVKDFTVVGSNVEKKYTNGDTQYYEITTSTQYLRVVRVGTSMFYVHCGPSFKEDAVALAEKIGY